jgi:hypothetical protein
LPPLAPALRSTCIGSVLERLGTVLKPAGHVDFAWRQSITPGEMLRKIADRAYAPYFGTHPPTGLLEQLRGEFESEAARRISLEETIRIYRFERVGA